MDAGKDLPATQCQEEDREVSETPRRKTREPADGCTDLESAEPERESPARRSEGSCERWRGRLDFANTSEFDVLCDVDFLNLAAVKFLDLEFERPVESLKHKVRLA